MVDRLLNGLYCLWDVVFHENNSNIRLKIINQNKIPKELKFKLFTEASLNERVVRELSDEEKRLGMVFKEFPLKMADSNFWF